ncbi:hypothetical protein RFI_01370 [Reticulomyxa filosa]|uniref:Uncharacterized protein n=1 Tax=Reticulomyxa filosa TaxID=46433 RepID=X6PC62_RETFI|nr:hypothetical protein RFI_01370 [Reticulomyxa filosa]|eukprot:ETO35693.1 hypothetical protein RFI_01370 [Reticulomyxa filosa]
MYRFLLKFPKIFFSILEYTSKQFYIENLLSGLVLFYRNIIINFMKSSGFGSIKINVADHYLVSGVFFFLETANEGRAFSQFEIKMENEKEQEQKQEQREEANQDKALKTLNALKVLFADVLSEEELQEKLKKANGNPNLVIQDIVNSNTKMSKENQIEDALYMRRISEIDSLSDKTEKSVVYLFIYFFFGQVTRTYCNEHPTTIYYYYFLKKKKKKRI